MPYLRQRSLIGIPTSASFKIATIWRSVFRLLIVKLFSFSLKEILRVICIILRGSYKFQRRITLEHLDWESAYESSFSEISYGRMSDVCTHCLTKYESGKDVPGLLCWEHGFGFEIQGKLSSFSIAECLKCKSHTVYCDSCGWITIAEHEEPCC